MGTGSDWLLIIAAMSSRWWYPWTLYASQHSSNGKSASRLLAVQMWLAPTPVPDVVHRRCDLSPRSSRRDHALCSSPLEQTN